MSDSFHDDIAAYRNDPAGAGISVRPSAGPTRITFGPNGWTEGGHDTSEPLANRPAGVTVRIGGTTTWNAGSNELGSGMKQQWNAGLDKPDPSMVGVAATHSTLYGTAGGGRVTIPGIGETVAENAVRWGYCRWEGGRLVDVGTPQGQADHTEKQAQPEEQKPTEDPGAAVYPASEDKALADAIAPLQQGSYDTAIATALANVVHRDGDFSQVARRLAEGESSAGNPMSPTQANELIQDVVAYHERAAERAVSPMLGDDPARIGEFRDWIANDKNRFHEALSELVYKRNPAKFVEAAVQFKRANPGDLSKYTAQGFQVTIGPKGETLLTHPNLGGKWIDARVLQS